MRIVSKASVFVAVFGVVSMLANAVTSIMANGLPATGLSQVEPVPVSPLRASIPFAGETK